MNRAWKRALWKKYRTLQIYGAAGVAGAAAIGVVGVTNQAREPLARTQRQPRR
ncbi:MAG: hypothetical protein M0008_06540 [Actinomycetota bacterium]|nr:hypothetical protein [Actinomycetota bacterium]